ncbi:hypothetical protein [Sinorhizobium sp. BG8]|uniref:hypothetical protein n=1 Tax=Sinorhizobium sp. BG8 TaxID=2613773 RepID=UPI00193E9BE2|nr:hypothetical protein [Sinorhizobium sp. BG8]QRM55118.1 hypothetical protein F3Y30_11685 [Sinorhizobium sp. BG8]
MSESTTLQKSTPLSSRITPKIEAHIRARILAGAIYREIAEEIGCGRPELISYVATRKPRWLREELARRRAADSRRTILYKPVARKSGSYDMRPVSVAYNTMHVLQMMEEGR